MIRSRLFLLLQYLLPKHLVTAAVYRLSRIRSSRFKNMAIKAFAKAYDIDTAEAEKNVPDDYATLNQFFTRELKPGARPIDGSTDSIIAPVDGTVSGIGRIHKRQLVQAKGIQYALDDLLATDLSDVRTYAGGSFATIYLAPYNYHRVHSPLAATLQNARYVPGDLFSVNDSTVSMLPQLFARNERLICHFETAPQSMIVVFVGALNVGSISTPWTGEIRPRRRGIVDDIALDYRDTPAQVAKGDLLGWFNMGSTVIVLLPPGQCRWHESVSAGTTVRMGEAIGTLGET